VLCYIQKIFHHIRSYRNIPVMTTPVDADIMVGLPSFIASTGVVSLHEKEMSGLVLLSRQSDTTNQNEICGRMISISPDRKRNMIHSKMLSPGRPRPLPCTSGFRLQPRKNISTVKSHCPGTPSSSASSRGRKRGANEASSIGLKSLPRQHESAVVDSPVPVHHAMQSMSIRSPTPSTPSFQDNSMRDKETPSPFIVFSPALKPSPYRQRPRSDNSFCSIDASTKPPSSVVSASSRVAPMYGSPRRKAKTNNNLSNNDDYSEYPSTPRSHCHTANSCHAPATPGSIRTLPSPHTTPLPRSIKLTPRSRRQKEELSNESSIFLSPNEKLDRTSSRNESPSIFTFEGGMESFEDTRQRAIMRTCSYEPSPFSSSRTSMASRKGQAISSVRGESGSGSLRVETRSLLGDQDSTSTLDYIISANARIAAQDCDGSLSDDSDEPFVLANPNILAQERDAITMPPPRPCRRRRMSPTSTFSNSADVSSTTKLESGINQASAAEKHCEMNDEDKQLNPRKEFIYTQWGNKAKSANSMYFHNYSGRLQAIESCSSLVGLGLSESSSTLMGSKIDPATPPRKLDALIDCTPPGTPSKTSICISRSDADNVHLTIANMAVLHQELSPTLTACRS